MDHWFDRATKFIARDGLSRRSLIAGAAATGASALVAAGPRAPRPARSHPPARATAAPVAPGGNSSGCSLVNGKGGTLVSFGAAGSYNGKTLTLRGNHTSWSPKHPSGRTQIKVELGSVLVLGIETSAVQTSTTKGRSNPVIQTTLTYGTPITGLHHVVAIDRNGAMQGYADGRPFTGTSGHSSARMRDGKSAPAPHLDPVLARAIQSVFASAANNLSNCRGTHASALGTHVATRSEILAHPLRELARRSGGAVQIGQTFGGGPCADCYNECDVKMLACEAKAFASCANLGPGCLFTIGLCINNWKNCNSGCYQTGGPCCSVKCHPINVGESTCCATGETCCGDACCNSSTPICAYPTTENANYGFCCPSGTVGCIGISGGYGFENCCPKGQCCGGNLCCSEGQYCASGPLFICCPKGQTLCGGQCCSGKCLTDTHGNQTCCSSANLCGNQCCSGPNQCKQTVAGPKICCGGSICGDQCCSNGEICSGGKCIFGKPCGKSQCGLTNPICCNGVCCPSNQTCVKGKCTGAKCKHGTVPCQYTINLCCPPGAVCCGKTCCSSTQTCCNGVCSQYQCAQ